MRYTLLVLSLLVAVAVSRRLKFDDNPDQKFFNYPRDEFDAYMSALDTMYGHSRQGGEEPCPLVCQLDYKPVCGNDGNTYNNECELNVAGCRQRKRLFVQKEGKCDSK